MDLLSNATHATLVGLIGGIALGLAARMGRFCSLGAVEDALYGGSLVRLRMWALAGAVAIAATALAAAAGLVDPAESFYLAQPWSPVSTILGGLIFGYGMALVGTCAYGALARFGGGDLRALVMVLTIGVSAYMAIGGLTARPRAALAEATAMANGSLAELAGGGLGVGAGVVSLGLAAALALWALRDPELRAGRGSLGWPVLVGGAVAFGWVGTAWAANHGFEPVAVGSYTFVAPSGDMLLYAMTSTGSTLDFGIGAVVGVVAGAALGSILRGEFRWEACDDPRELRRQIFGAFLMGTGGVMALGCTVGQSLTALSVLAPSAFLAIAAMGLGAVVGLKMLVEGRLTA